MRIGVRLQGVLLHIFAKGVWKYGTNFIPVTDDSLTTHVDTLKFPALDYRYEMKCELHLMDS